MCVSTHTHTHLHPHTRIRAHAGTHRTGLWRWPCHLPLNGPHGTETVPLPPDIFLREGPGGWGKGTPVLFGSLHCLFLSLQYCVRLTEWRLMEWGLMVRPGASWWPRKLSRRGTAPKCKETKKIRRKLCISTYKASSTIKCYITTVIDHLPKKPSVTEACKRCETICDKT